jgi:chemotaxis protein CheD
MDSSARELQVHMCQIAIGGGNDVLRATLGSCVGIGVLWRERSLYGLAHCLLPEAPADAGVTGVTGASGAPASASASTSGSASTSASAAKYVSQAVPALMKMMEIPRAAHRSVEVVLAGGANMVRYVREPHHAPIGELNVRTAQRLLAALNLRIVHTEVGGECGRQLLIDCGQHAYAVKTFRRST